MVNKEERVTYSYDDTDKARRNGTGTCWSCLKDIVGLSNAPTIKGNGQKAMKIWAKQNDG